MRLPILFRRALLALILNPGLSLPALAADSAPTSCGPSPAGSPCGGAGPASEGNTSNTNQGAGNPIHVISGNKYQREDDLPALPGVLGLEIVRHYNASFHGLGYAGYGWRLSYETDLYAIGNTLQIVQADGTRLIFNRHPDHPSLCSTPDPAHGRVLIHHTPRGEEYVWHWTNGRRLAFNPQGKLESITAPSGEFLTLQRGPRGELLQVTDPQGRSLVFEYAPKASSGFKGVIAIQSPVGRFVYRHDDDPHSPGLSNLLAVTYPATLGESPVTRRYHYGETAYAPGLPHALTGISLDSQIQGKPTSQRLNTWAYDGAGRAILSVKGVSKTLGKDGKPVPGTGLEQVKLQFLAPALPGQVGKTVLTNSLGASTTYTHTVIADEYRLLEVKGAGCARCGEPNVQYRYDPLGRLTAATRLSPEGKPLRATRTERDRQGRPIRVSAVAYVNGRAQAPRLQIRYEYQGEATQPSLIARPSVIPGKEHRARIAYNAHGQPLSVTEIGFSPAISGQAAVPISRTTTYTYRTINGHSLLAQVDGPLKNGPTNSPADSDITRMEWDSRGSRVLTMTAPGGFKSTMQYDAVGRISEVRNIQDLKTTFTYDAANRLIRLASSAANWAQAGIKPVVQSYRYDAVGNMVELGSGMDKTFHPQTRQAFDVAGRLLWQAEALGILKRASYDTEGHLLSSTVQTRSFEQTERFRYDEQNRLIQVADNTGSVRNLLYEKPRTARSRTASAFHILKDDFGREVETTSASHGTIIKRYDAADRLIEQSNDKGDAQTYAYGLTGQRIHYTVTPKTGTPQTTTWRYEYRRLVEVNDPNQTERIRYNTRGLPESKTVSLKLANGTEAIHITRYTYTADGSLQSQSLPDGTKILYERNGQGQVIAVTRQTSPWTLFGWGKTLLVKDLERDLIGLRSMTYGNGIQGQWQRSREGVLARVVYTQPKGRAGGPLRVAAVSRPTLKPGYLDGILNTLLPAAHAQTPPPASNKLPGALGIPTDPQALFDARLLYDDTGNVLLQKHQGEGPQQTQAYAYDRQEQLIAAQTASRASTIRTAAGASPVPVWRYYYDRNGNRVLAQEQVPVTEMGQTRKASYRPDSNALVTPPDLGREYVWNAQGQLIAIRQENKELAHYRYNHRGLRISKQAGAQAEYTLYNDQRQRTADLDANGHITRQYIWLADHLIATLDAPQPKALRAPAEGFWQELAQTAQALWNSLTGNADRIAFVHVNYLGAPIAVTDVAGQILWQADYAPYGKLIKVSADANRKATYTLALRLPGQWEDAESGLFYNDLRYYDPTTGRYLSSDPLGRLAEALGSPNAYAYVNNNPLSYIDPYGLILFAFDGTGNDESDPNTLSNVVKFRSLYQDGQPYYITGPGMLDPATGIGPGPLDIGGVGDAATAYTGKARIVAMINRLDNYSNGVDDNTAFNIDIVGFSRGAAEARDFANQINANFNNGYYQYKDTQGNAHCQKVNFNFMGLWDTVLSTHTGSYQLGIPDSFKYVAQAVALNEYRGGAVAFPLESIMGGASPAGVTRIERGFLGSHSDIGGSFPDGDLAKVAMVWMVDQATAAGIQMNTSSLDTTIIANPVIHDKSSNLLTGQPTATSEDRDVHYMNGTTVKQRQANIFGMSYADTQQFITYKSNPNSIDSISGTVDMKRYLEWLNGNGYNINMTIQ